MNDFSGWSKYRNIEKIGEGGMGVVYKAFDPQLKRFVALKFVKKDSQDNLKRFVQEAQAQAQLTHKNICRVYEVGEYEDSPYISMQYIDGISLKKATHQLNIDQKVMVMRTVASALYEAHKNGIIHRDIKPANIMLDQNSDGKWVPYVMDFGLAREIESPSLTMSGMVLGTPNYVSPELAMGEKDIVDRRSDIFSLGSTMYDFFTGQRPFKADSTLEILMKVTRHDPIPPRALIPAIPQDMETILLKCLEKEPHRRYDSARAVAEDCRHYLDGEPIKARQPTITYRILKKTKKHKAAFIMAASLFITLLTLVVVWLHSSWAVDRTAEISQRFGQTIESIENSTRISHTIPPHDIRPQIKRVQEQMADLKSQMEEAGSLSSGPGNYALGRGHFILHQYDNALIYLKKSWELGHQTPKVAYVMGLTLGHIYKRELDRIHLSAKQYKKYEKDRLEAKFLKPALEFLKKSWGTKSESPRYLEGVIAFYEKRYMDAMVNVQTAFTACPWLYEAKCMEGEILQAMGNDKKDRGELNGALVDFKRAEAVFRKAIRIGESDPQSYALLCNLLKDVIYLRLKEMGEDVCPIIDETLTIAEKARVLNKDRGDMYLLMATLHRYAAEYKSEHGKEPYGDLAKAIQKAQMAKELEPNNAFVFLSLGETFYFQGYYEFTHGKDPLELFNKAHVNLQKAIKLKPGEPSIHMRMGVLYAYMGYYQAGKGKNPTKSLSAARNNFTIVTEIIPDDGLAFNRIGGTFFLQADYESEHGKDQLNSINQAISFYKKSNAVNPNAVAYLNLGGALVRLSNYQIHHGQNPAATLK
ncbi:MAG: protein kinase, partial [bacterium]|nr:protein kinase [bacterium]